MEKNKPKRFTNEFKVKVINEYLNGKGVKTSCQKVWNKTIYD